MRKYNINKSYDTNVDNQDTCSNTSGKGGVCYKSK